MELYFWVVLSVMLIGVAMAIMFAISTYKPIESIITALERPESWMDGGKDNGEITYIASKIVSMIQTNEKLGQEFANQLQIVNQTYDYALQVQINPHFLFNTLNIINMMIVDDYGPGQRSSKTLVALSKLLRFGLGNEDKFVSVGEEVAYTKIYVNILKMHYIDLFDVTYDVDASVADKRILKLCLQPLVENAINHGLIEKEHDGQITISIQNQKRLLSIEVTDNGVGMSEEALQKLRERIYENAVIDGKQIGIKNVRF